MLLVRSSELKNLGKKPVYKTWAYVFFTSCFLASSGALAATESLSNPTSIVSIFLSLLLVVAIVFALAWLMRRFNVTQGGSAQIKVVASMMVGTKERIVVVQIGSEQHMLGITAHNINHLAKLDSPLATESLAAGDNFKDKLIQAMAGKLTAVKGATGAQTND